MNLHLFLIKINWMSVLELPLQVLGFGVGVWLGLLLLRFLIEKGVLK